MFSVPLREIPRTISFRTALLFLVLFGCSFLALFGYIYWQTSFYLTRQTNASLHRIADNRGRQTPEVREREIRLRALQDVDGKLPHTLYDPEGKFIAGMITQLPPFPNYDTPTEFHWKKPDGSVRPVRFMVHRLADGNQLLVGQDVHDIREFDKLLVNALVSGGALLLVAGLLGAVILGYAARRRLDSLGVAIKGIIDGDLSGRLPTRGNGDDIDRIAIVVNGMLGELERLMHEVKGVCDDIAHDLRTPLTRLIAGLERAERRGQQDPEDAASIDAALHEARGLMLTFRALLRISEIEDSARRSNFSSVDLNKIGEDATDFFEPLAEERNIALQFAPAPSPALMAGDAQLLFDAMCNLLDNALKFIPTGGRITLAVIAHGGRVGIWVTDDGPGIPEAEREAVFRRLYRSESSRHTAGNGLGLSMVAAVARLHEMRIRVVDAQPGCQVEMVQQ